MTRKNCSGKAESKAPEKVSDHPCYGNGSHKKFGRIHLPVAPECNISCGYCDRRFDCPNENRPGVSSDVISPQKAVNRVDEILEKEPRITVVGFAGPGDSLANEETFETLELVQDRFPDLKGCISTNGLLLPEKVEQLDKLGVEAVTVTVNAVSPEVGEKIYKQVVYDGEVYRGPEAFQILNVQQMRGIKKAADRGMVVKVNSILMPEINEGHLDEVARTARELGAYVHNITPLIPQADFEEHRSPSQEELADAQQKCSGYLKQFYNCQQCRADAAGMLGEGCASVNVTSGGT